MLSKDYSAEFKQRFADRYADGATITMLQHEFGLTKSTVKLWRERIDQGGVGAIDRPKKNNRYPQEFKLRVVGAYLRGEGDYKALALEQWRAQQRADTGVGESESTPIPLTPSTPPSWTGTI